MATRTKLLIADRDFGGILRCDSDGGNPERWGLFTQKLNASSLSPIQGVAWNDATKKAYYATASSGVKYTDYNDFSGGTWNVAGGQLASDNCYGLVMSPDGAKVVTFHDSVTRTADCVFTTTNLQAWSQGHAAWDMNKGMSDNGGVYLFGWDDKYWGLTASVLPIIRFNWSDGSNLACSWIPPKSCYIQDVDVDDNDEYLYAVIVFSSLPAGPGATTNAIVKIRVSNMSYVTLSYISTANVPQQAYNKVHGSIDVTCDYFVYTYYQTSPNVEWVGKVFRLSTMLVVGIYSESSSPKWNADRGSWAASNLWAFAIKDTYTLLNYSTDSGLSMPLYSCMAVDSSNLTLTLRWNVYGTSDSVQGEYKWDGTNYCSRKWPWELGEWPMGLVAAGSGNFLFGYRKTGGVILVDRNFPFREPSEISRASGGALYIADSKCLRVWKYDEYDGTLVGVIPTTTASSPKNFMGLSLDETDDRIALWDDRDNRLKWIDDLAWTNIVSGVLNFCQDVFQQDSHTTWAADDATGNDYLWKYTDENFGAGTSTRPTTMMRKFLIDPDDGKFYVGTSTEDRVVRMDDENGLNLVAYGTGGSGVGQFDDVWGVAVDGAYCYVVDRQNHRIAKFEKAAFDGTGWSAFGSEGLFGATLKLSDAFDLVAYLETSEPKSEETVTRAVWDRVPEWPMGHLARTPSRRVRFEGAHEGKKIYPDDYGIQAWELPYLEDESGLTTIREFFAARSGKYEYFLFKDPDLYSRTGESVGTGNGTRTEWRLPDNPVIDDSETIYVAAVAQTRDVDYTICNASGLITFTSAPAGAAAITADYEFYHRAVTDMPALKIENDGFKRYRVTVNIREISLSKINRS